MTEPNYGAKISRTKDNWETEKEWNPAGWPVYANDQYADERDGYAYCLYAEDGNTDKAIQVVLTEDFLIKALAEIRSSFYKNLPDLQLGVKAQVEEEIPWPDHATLSVDEESWPELDYVNGVPQNNLNSAQDIQSVADEQRSYRCPTCGPNCNCCS